MAEEAQKPNPEVITGNECVIFVNNVMVGFGKSLEASINNNVQPIKAIGTRKPKGMKSLDWSGTVNMEFHLLAVPEEGVVQFDTYDDEKADDIYTILVVHKTSKRRVGVLKGAVNTEGFTIMNNDFTGRRVEFALTDWKPREGFN